jgi:hypothetical protein
MFVLVMELSYSSSSSSGPQAATVMGNPVQYYITM